MPGHEHKQENANRYENREATTHKVPSYGNGGLARIHLLPGMAPLDQVLSQKRNIFGPEDMDHPFGGLDPDPTQQVVRSRDPCDIQPCLPPKIRES